MQLPKLDSATFHMLEQKRILFDMLDLKVALLVFIGSEAVFCLIDVIIGLAIGLHSSIFMQLVECLVCASVFFTVATNRPANFLLIYLVYNAVDIAYMLAFNLPSIFVQTESDWVTSVDGGLADINHTVKTRFHQNLVLYGIISNLYLLFAGLSWYVVYTIYKVMGDGTGANPIENNGGVGGSSGNGAFNNQFAHQRFTNGGHHTRNGSNGSIIKPSADAESARGGVNGAAANLNCVDSSSLVNLTGAEVV